MRQISIRRQECIIPRNSEIYKGKAKQRYIGGLVNIGKLNWFDRMILNYRKVSANQTQPLKRKAKASNETSALIIRAIYLYFTTGYYTSLPTAVTLLYSQLLYLTVSLLTV